MLGSAALTHSILTQHTVGTLTLSDAIMGIAQLMLHTQHNDNDNDEDDDDEENAVTLTFKQRARVVKRFLQKVPECHALASNYNINIVPAIIHLCLLSIGYSPKEEMENILPLLRNWLKGANSPVATVNDHKTRMCVVLHALINTPENFLLGIARDFMHGIVSINTISNHLPLDCWALPFVEMLAEVLKPVTMLHVSSLQIFEKLDKFRSRVSTFKSALAVLQPYETVSKATARKKLRLSTQDARLLHTLGKPLPTTQGAASILFRELASDFKLLPEEGLNTFLTDIMVAKAVVKRWKLSQNVVLSKTIRRGTGGVAVQETTVRPVPSVTAVYELMTQETKKPRMSEAEAATKIQRAYRCHLFRLRLAQARLRNQSESNPNSPVLSDLHATVFQSAWEILLSTRAQQALRLLSKNEGLRVLIFARLRSIAEGNWSRSVAKPLSHPHLQAPVYRSVVLVNLRIVWQVDVGYLKPTGMFGQYIKVWSVGDHKEMDRAVDQIAICHKSMSSERLRRSTMRATAANGATIPFTFEDDGGAASYINCIRAKPSAFNNEEALLQHDLLVTAKFIPLSKMFLHNLISEKALQDSEFPFAVSQQEALVIHHPGSVLLCGRSGTGKTSCTMFRLLSMFYVYHHRVAAPLFQSNAANSAVAKQPTATHIHQIFVTASPSFCARVKAYFGRLLQAVTIDEAESFLSEKADEFLSLVAKEKEIVEDSDQQFEELLTELKLVQGNASGSSKLGQDIQLAEDPESNNFDNVEERLMRSLPQSFMDLRSEHFPLFVTHRQLLSMLRVGLKLDEPVKKEDDSWSLHDDFISFLHKYWPHFDSRNTAKLDPSLVFNEIMGVIKGSESAARSSCGYLSKEAYVNLSERYIGSYPAAMRERIYAIFVEYQKAKGSAKDKIDKSNEVNQLLRTKGYKGPKVNEIYIDEVQDLTMAELLPLVTICSSFGSGLMFAGDTAQTISRGSSFRFEDLSSMIYRHLGEQGARMKPKQYQLTRNYRSHDGILRLAATVLDLVHEYFPGTVDVMERDLGVIDGPAPAWFLGSESQLFALFGPANASEELTTETLEFGAEQVILVRNQEDKAGLLKRFADVLIMTIEESKGMEFEDVLLFNPFASSPAGKKWRIFLKSVPGNTISYPQFRAEKHNILGSELKVLYTGITRARQRLWIYDPSEEYRLPILELWKAHNLIEVVESTLSQKFTSLSKKSTPDAWLLKGKEFFERKQYEQAVVCFKQDYRLRPTVEANERIKLAEAYKNRHEGNIALESGNVTAGGTMLREASSLFVEINRVEMAAKCLERCKDIRRAAELYESIKLFRDAVRCFEEIGCHKDVGRCFHALEEYEQALESYKKGKHWDDAIELIKKHHSKCPKKSVRHVKIRASRHFKKHNQLEKSTHALLCTGTPEEHVDHCLEEGFYERAVDLLAGSGRYREAAHVCCEKMGDFSRATQILEKSKDVADIIQCIKMFKEHTLDRLFQTQDNWVIGKLFDGDERKEAGDKLRRLAAKLSSLKDEKHAVSFEEIERLDRQLDALKVCLSDKPSAYIADIARNKDAASAFMTVTIMLQHHSELRRNDDGSISLANYHDWIKKIKLWQQKFMHLANTLFETLYIMSQRKLDRNQESFVSDLEELFGVITDPFQPLSRQIRVKRFPMIVATSTEPKDEGLVITVPVQVSHYLMRAYILKLLEQTINAVSKGANEFLLIRPCPRTLVMGFCRSTTCQNHHLSKEECEIFQETRCQMAREMAHLAANIQTFYRHFQYTYVDTAMVISEESNLVDMDIQTVYKTQRRWSEILVDSWWENSLNIFAMPSSVGWKAIPESDFGIVLNLTKSVWGNDLKKSSPLHVGALIRLNAFNLITYRHNSFGWLAHIFGWAVFNKLQIYTYTKDPMEAAHAALWLAEEALLYLKPFEDETGAMVHRKYLHFGVILQLLEVAVTLIILHAKPCLILPRNWITAALLKFPCLQLGQTCDIKGLSTLTQRLLMEFLKTVTIASSFEKLRMGNLWILLHQHETDMWTNPESELKNVGMSFFPRWFSSSDPFSASKLITQANGDCLDVLSTGTDNINYYWLQEAMKGGAKIKIDPLKPLREQTSYIALTSTLRVDAKEFVPSQQTSANAGAIVEAEGPANEMSKEAAARKILQWWRKIFTKEPPTLAEQTFNQVLHTVLPVVRKSWTEGDLMTIRETKLLYLTKGVKAMADLMMALTTVRGLKSAGWVSFLSEDEGLLDFEDFVRSANQNLRNALKKLEPASLQHVYMNPHQMNAVIILAEILILELQESIAKYEAIADSLRVKSLQSGYSNGFDDGGEFIKVKAKGKKGRY